MIRVTRVEDDLTSQSFDDYLTLKYRVFVEEQGLALPVDTKSLRVLKDQYDEVSEQFVAYDETGRAIGTIRVTSMDRAFPYKEYFNVHLKSGALVCEPSKCFSVTSMAVLPAYRGKPALFRGVRVSVAKGLLWHVVDELRDAGFELGLLTAVKGASAAFFEHCGCYVFEGPFFSDSFGLEVFNLGLLVNDSERFAEIDSPLGLTCNVKTLNAQETGYKTYLGNQHRLVMQESRNLDLFK